MKTTRIKVLFTVFPFSAAVLSVMQAMRIEICNFLRKSSVIVGCGLFCLFYCTYLVGLDVPQDARDYLKKHDKEYTFVKKELLAKRDKQELIEGFPGEKYYLVSLEPKWVQQSCNALKSLDIPDSFVEKILILGKKYKYHQEYSWA